MKVYLQKRYRLKEKLRLVNYIDCEAHRELLLQALADDFNELSQKKK